MQRRVGFEQDALRPPRRLFGEVLDADAARAEEKRPHDEAAKAVQSKWKPLLDKADRAVTAAQKPLTDYLLRLERERQAEAQRLAEEARKAEEQAQAAVDKIPPKPAMNFGV